MSITSIAFFTALNAASITCSGSPAMVTTVRLVAAPGSTSSNLTPYLIGDLLYHSHVAPLAEIWHAFDNLFH
jgi:hypothetical protein